MNSIKPIFRVVIVVFSVMFAALAPAADFDDSLRPEIVVSHEASDCPSAKGAFVVLLDPAHGMLLLSGAPFPGGGPIADALNGFHYSDGVSSGIDDPSWSVEGADSNPSRVFLYGKRYPFHSEYGYGCVGFDRQHWSSEGDLVTYARWLVEKVYLQLPVGERYLRPNFRISDRDVAFAVERPGYGTFHLKGKEGANRACKYEDSGRIYLFRPFVLDEASGRIAVKAEYTDGSYFDTETKSSLGWTTASPGEPGTLVDTSFVIVAEGVTSAE